MRNGKFMRLSSLRETLIPVFAVFLLSFFQVALAVGPQNRASKYVKPSNKTCLLQSTRTRGSIDRVTVKLDAGGDLKFIEDKKIAREKMSVGAELSYAEKTLAVPEELSKVDGGINPTLHNKENTGANDALRSVRYYDRAEATIKVGDDGFKPALRDKRRLIAASAGESGAIFSPLGPLTREELDLLDVNGNSLLVDRLLPGKPVAEGDSWEHPDELMAALLGLDKVAKCEVKSKLEELSDDSALMAMAGRVEGAVGGVSTRLDVKAKYRFMRKTGRIDWLGLLVKEDRDIGHVNAGVELVARVQVQIKPADACEPLADGDLEGLPLVASAETCRLVYRSKTGGWEFSHDRRWFVTSDSRSHVVLRLVDRGELIAQCNVTALSDVKPGEQITLEQFQNDVKEALGESFGEFVDASQNSNEVNYRVLRVAAGGESSQLPIRWIYYLIADEKGRQVALTFTVEQTLVERLADSDRALVETLRFTDAAVAETSGEEKKSF